MFLSHISLQNFRSYQKKEFDFSQSTTLVIGPNTAGKSNLIEAIFFIAKADSFRIDDDDQLIKIDKEIARIKGKIDDKKLEVLIAKAGAGGNTRSFKKFLINGVSKRRADFVGNFLAVLFAPNDLEIIVGSPSKRRGFIDNVMSQVDREYRLALGFYEKGLRSRNALLHRVKETGRRNDKEFVYWDNLLIIQGQKLTRKREEFINYLNTAEKKIFDFKIFYDKSTISIDRLLQYKDAEVGVGVTLVGPHRDDVKFQISNFKSQMFDRDLKNFGSRGQQRLAILQLKTLELGYIEQKTGNKPTLLLDDIFSELDEAHINLISEFVGNQQSIITTTHEEFIPKKLLKKANVIKLKK